MSSLFLVLSLLVNSYLCLKIPIVSEVLGEVIKDAEVLIGNGVADSYRNPCQLIESRNFICDEHFVITKDGYILSIQHIINPVLIKSKVKTIKPLIIQHGLFGSATHWLINSEGGFAADWTGQVIDADLSIEGRNVPYLLSNLGYDVWITNLRGCRYSRNHTYLDPDTDNDYWNFSYQQMISYDAPTFIDYVLKQTGHSKLGWIGHSLGTAVLFGLLSEQPEYSTKIKPFIALAPVAHVKHIQTPLRVFADVPGLLEILTAKGGELSLPKAIIDLAADHLCVLPLANEVCANIFYLLGGYDPEQFNLTRSGVYIEGGFCGTSVWTIVHFGYNILKDQFAKFDYGTSGNIKQYGFPDPPQYNLSAINLENIILMQSDNDLLSDPTDRMTLKNALKVPFIEYNVPNPKFAHLDFLWAIDVYEQVYGPMVQYLQKFN